MYRQVQERKAKSDMGEEQFPQLVSVARIVKLPIVEKGWHLATGIYTRIKKSNSVVSWGLKTAEASLQVALESTLPAVIVLERPITLLDSLLCKSLDIVEERVPVVTQPPAQIYENTKDYVSKVIVLPVLRRADLVKKFGLNQASSAILRLDNVIEVADKYVDQYLPGTAPEENHEENNLLANTKGLQTIQRADRFSRKFRRRLTECTVAKLKALRQYSEDALRLVFYTGELLAKDPKALKEKLAALWTELSKDEPKNQERPANLEQLTVMVIRELARRVVHLVNYSREGIAAFPPAISHSLHVAANYCTQLADFVVKTANLNGAKDAAIARARIQLIKLQDILKDINTYTSQLLERIAVQIAKKNEDTKRAVQNIHNNGQHSGSNNLNAVD